MADDSIFGTNPCGARSFEPAIPASGSGSPLADIAKGGYYLCASVDAWFKLTKSGGSVAAVPGTTQPVVNALTFLPSGVVVPITVTDSAAQFSVVSATSATGLLRISGPMITP